MVIRNWEEVTPYVGHETALIWPIFRGKGTKDLGEREAPLLGTVGFTLHRMQAGMEGDCNGKPREDEIGRVVERVANRLAGAECAEQPPRKSKNVSHRGHGGHRDRHDGARSS